MNLRTFIEYLTYLGMESIPRRVSALAARLTTAETNIAGAITAVQEVRLTSQPLVTQVLHDPTVPQASAITVNPAARPSWYGGTGGSGRPFYSGYIDGATANAPLLGYEKLGTTVPLPEASIGVNPDYFGAPTTFMACSPAGFIEAGSAPGLRIRNSGQAGLGGASFISGASSAGVFTTGFVAYGSSANASALTAGRRMQFAVVESANDSRTGSSVAGLTLTVANSATTPTFTLALPTPTPGTFPTAMSAGATDWGVGDVVTVSGSLPANFASGLASNIPYVISSIASDGSSITLEGGPRWPSTDGAYAGITVQRLRGPAWSVSPDGAVLFHRRFRLFTTNYYNGEKSSIGAVLNADGTNLDFGAGPGLYIYDGTTKNGATFRGFRRLGDGAYAATATAGAALVTTRTANGITTDLVRGLKTLMLSAASAVTVGTATTTPILGDGFDGQQIKLINVGANNITLTDQGTMAASNLRLTAATVVLAPRSSVELTFSSAIGDWVQTGALVQPL